MEWNSDLIIPISFPSAVKLTQCFKVVQLFEIQVSWPEIAGKATAHARGCLAIWPPYTLRKRIAEIKQMK